MKLPLSRHFSPEFAFPSLPAPRLQPDCSVDGTSWQDCQSSLGWAGYLLFHSKATACLYLCMVFWCILHILYPFTSDLKIKIWFRDINSIIDTFGALPLGMSVLVTRMDLHLWKRLCPLKRRHVCTHPFALMDLCICWSAKQLMLGSVGLFGSQVPTPQKLPSGRPSGKWLWFPRKVWSP